MRPTRREGEAAVAPQHWGPSHRPQEWERAPLQRRHWQLLGPQEGAWRLALRRWKSPPLLRLTLSEPMQLRPSRLRAKRMRRTHQRVRQQSSREGVVQPMPTPYASQQLMQLIGQQIGRPSLPEQGGVAAAALHHALHCPQSATRGHSTMGGEAQVRYRDRLG